MSANPFTVVSNDPRAARVTGVARHEMSEMGSLSGGDIKSVEDENGQVGAFGRGVNDPTVTYVKLYRSGVASYVYLNASGDGVVVSTVQP